MTQVGSIRFRWWSWLLIAVLVAGSMPVLAMAAPPGQSASCAEEYTVQADDWLSKLAEKYLGDVTAYQAIVDATNEMSASDSRFAKIDDPNYIEVGWTLCIPAAAPASATPAPAEGQQPVASRIEFAAGASTATVKSTLAAGGIDRYILAADANQLMWVDLFVPNPSQGDGPDAVLVIWGVDGTVLISDHAGATSWSGTLPSSQDYYIDVKSTVQSAVEYDLGVAIPAAAAPDPALTETSVIKFEPTMPSGDAKQGKCWVNSNILAREDAWRCYVGENEIYDPCFSTADNPDMVICGADPVSGDAGFKVSLTEPLPAPDVTQAAKDAGANNGWYAKLADGRICSFADGATFGAFGQRANYSCSQAGETPDLWMFGDLIPGTVWEGVLGETAMSADQGPTGTNLRMVLIGTVWQ